MNFNATHFEGFVVSSNNDVRSIYANRARSRAKLLDAHKTTADETIMTQGVGASSQSLEDSSNAVIESEDRRTLYELLPPPPVAESNVGNHQQLKRGTDELEIPIGLNPFYMPSYPVLRSNQQQHIMFNLSSSIEPEVVPFLNENVGLDKRINFLGFPTNQLPPSSSKGYESESPNLNVAVEGTRGPLTESQLMELQNQKLIYSYINANMLVPPDLLNHSLCAHCFPSSPTNPKAWGNFRQVFSGIYVDPEPGRCRRSDGKKWRCANEALADEKYCEKHRNRGRIRQRFKNTARGRKARPVKGNAGASASARPTEPGASSLSKTENGAFFTSLVNKK